MYQCQNCGGELHFDISSQQLKCDYCKTLVDPAFFQDTLKGAQETTEFEVTKFICNQCGAEIISQDNTAAAFCSFCGASTLLRSRLSREKRPDAIIPFEMTKEDCIAAYRKHMKRAIFAPKELKDEKCVNGFRGIYMPYWVYDVTHKGMFSIPGEKYSREGSYDITRYYNLSGNIDAEYLGITHDASREFADDISETLAPYNVHTMQNFNPSYLSGFYADVSDVTPHIYDEDVVNLTSQLSVEAIQKVKKFSSYHIKEADELKKSPFNIRMDHPHYALFPVWFMSYRKNDRIAYVSINGQTGKISADIPVDGKKYALGSLLLALPIFLLLNLFISMKATTALIISTILSLLVVILSLVEVHKLQKREMGFDDRGRHNFSKNIDIPKIGAFMAAKKRWFEKKELLGILFTIISIFTALIILILRPVSDYIYYGSTFFSILSVLCAITDVIKDFNRLATRKLPQFNRSGGDDNVD